MTSRHADTRGRLRSHRADALIALVLAAVAAFGIIAGQSVKKRDMHCSRGEIFYDNQEYGRAIEEYTGALRHDPQWANAYANRASAYFNLGEVERAIDDFNKALAYDPWLAIAYWRRGIAHARNGDVERASSDRNKALELDPSLGP